MTETAGAVQDGFVLRMSVPASGELGALGPELGVKLAEQLGVTGPHAARVGETMAELARMLGSAPAGDLSYAFHKDGAELRIEARQGDETRTATVPLNA
jgi:hypothetical protein